MYIYLFGFVLKILNQILMSTIIVLKISLTVESKRGAAAAIKEEHKLIKTFVEEEFDKLYLPDSLATLWPLPILIKI